MNTSHLLAALSLSLSLPALAAADHEETPKRWYDDSFVLQVMDTEPHVSRAEVLAALGESAATWNHVGTGPEIAVAPMAAEGASHPVKLDGVNRVGVWQSGPWPYPAEAGAVTITYSTKGSDKISEVDIALNPAFPWARDHHGDDVRYDLANVLTHEIGHSLGLPDVKDHEHATMFFSIKRGETIKRDLASEDEGMLLELYEGIDMSSSSGCSAAGANTPAAGTLLLTTLLAARRLRKLA